MRNIMPMQGLCNIVPITMKAGIEPHDEAGDPGRARAAIPGPGSDLAGTPGEGKIGRASCRERGWGGGGGRALKKKKEVRVRRREAEERKMGTETGER